MRDSSGRPIAGALVRVLDPQTALAFDDALPEFILEFGACRALAVTDEAGRHELRDVPAGTHDVVVRAPAMAYVRRTCHVFAAARGHG